jgi:hypothetical protein
LDYADRQRDRQHGHDQVAAREHDETTLVQIRVSGKQPVRGQYQDHADERIHRHRGQQQETTEQRRAPPDRLSVDDGQEVQVTGDEVEGMLGLVDRGVLQDQVHQRRQMRADDHHRVQGRCGRRPGQRRRVVT